MDNPFGNVISERKPSGALILDGRHMADTKQCCHCGCHFVSVKGSGKTRGFCTHCHQVTCGNPLCDPCVSFVEKLQIIEAA